MLYLSTLSPYNRAVLRMLEGLQSSDSAVRSLTQSWVRTAVAKGSGESTHKLLQPLIRILLESHTKRRHKMDELSSKKITLTRKDAERDMKYAKYYFESLGIENPYLPSSKDQYAEIVQYYTQAFDASQILYALSLLQLVVGVDPFNLISTIGNTIIDVSAYMGQGLHMHTQANDTGKIVTPEVELPDTPTSLPFPTLSSQKSLLEVILSVCVDLLCSDYHPSLKASPEEEIENLRVKICCAGLLSMLLDELLKILAKHGANSDDSSPSEFKVCSPNFVSALLTLCDIQKVALLLMGKSVEWWVELSSGGGGGGGSVSSSTGGGKNRMWSDLARLSQLGGGSGDPGVILKSFYVHLLQMVQCMIVLDTQFSQSLPIKTISSLQSTDLITVVSGVNISGTLPAISPGCATASQHFFRDFMLRVLSDFALSGFHNDLLHMLTGTTSNLLSQQLMELGPKVVKQLCSNIEGAVAVTLGPRNLQQYDSVTANLEKSSTHLCIAYFDSILSIVTWCLFGDIHLYPLKGKSVFGKSYFRLHHRSSNPFFDIIRVKQAEGPKECYSPMHKQPSAMAWLLGVFSSQKMALGTESVDGISGEAGLFSRVGVGSLAGQHMVMLLPAVYNAMTDVWVEFCFQSAIVARCASGADGGVFLGGVVSATESMESCLIREHQMVCEVRTLMVNKSLFCVRYVYSTLSDTINRSQWSGGRHI